MKGLSLLRGCLDELPKERKATIAGDMGELKRELREKVINVLVMFISMSGSIKLVPFKGSKRERAGEVKDAAKLSSQGGR